MPADYQPMKVSDVAAPGKPRQIQAFELRMNIIADATIDLLFTKNRVQFVVPFVFLDRLCQRNCARFYFVYLVFPQETNAVHVNVGAGSYLEVNIPMTVGENGIHSIMPTFSLVMYSQ